MELLTIDFSEQQPINSLQNQYFLINAYLS